MAAAASSDRPGAACAPSSEAKDAPNAARDLPSPVGEPAVIRRLHATVVNRIAAGEVILRPSSAVKELLENSLDARATKVSVLLKDGGLKLLQITDNGCGIRVEDFGILCERFTTSKLSTFEDLQHISTFGFRGEALASITHVAHVAVTSMTGSQKCAYRARFCDGKLVSDSPKVEGAPVPCAGIQGTQILVEDLFYNVPIRRQAIRNASEEYKRCLSVMSKYALHFPAVSFSCKKHGGVSADLHTLGSGSRIDVVRTLYGQHVARELLPVKFSSEAFRFSLDGLVTNANYSEKKMVFVLFINNRLVECAPVKKMVESVYSELLPRNSHPWVYLSLTMDPRDLDVNVHPTKREVRFLHEEEVLESVDVSLRQTLGGANQSRTFYTQSVLQLPAVAPQPSPAPEEQRRGSEEGDGGNNGDRQGSGAEVPSRGGGVAGSGDVTLTRSDGTAVRLIFEPPPQPPPQAQPIVENPEAAAPVRDSGPRAVASDATKRPRAASSGGVRGTRRDNKLVRTDSANPSGRLEAYLKHPEMRTLAIGGKRKRASEPQGGEADVVVLDDIEDEADADPVSQKHEIDRVVHAQQRLRRKPILLRSVHALIEDVTSSEHPEFHDLFARHTFVGCVNERFSLMQYGTKLYLVDVFKISKCFMYQRVLSGFGDFRRVRLQPPASVSQLVSIALDRPSGGWTPQDGEKAAIAQYSEKLLVSKAAMLGEYFGIDINSDACVEALPELVAGYVPPMYNLPLFMLRLAVDCEWTSEKECFQSICEQIADFYSVCRPEFYARDDSSASSSSSEPPAQKEQPSLLWTIEHVIFPSMRSAFVPPREIFDNQGVLQLACLESLYKVFERC